MIRKGFVGGLVALLVVPCLFSSGMAMQVGRSSIITVDDEPGDADYTTIKAAVCNASVGDTIEVFSGRYNESMLLVYPQGLTLMGVAHELGSGNDTGKPVVSGWFVVDAPFIVFCNFTLVNAEVDVHADDCVVCDNDFQGGVWTVNVGTDDQSRSRDQVLRNTFESVLFPVNYNGIDGVISANTLRRCENSISIGYNSTGTTITHNVISNGSIGILYADGSGLIANNSVTNEITGFSVETHEGQHVDITHNIIRNCTDFGIEVLLYRNSVKVTQNNFFNNTMDVVFLQNRVRYYGLLSPVFSQNFYDSWQGTGPMVIHGVVIFFMIPFIYLPVYIRWHYRDRHPASSPFKIIV